LQQLSGSTNLASYGASLGSFYFADLRDIEVYGEYWINAPRGKEGGFRVWANLYWLGAGITPTVRITVTVGTGPYEYENFSCPVTGGGSSMYLSPGHNAGETGPRIFWKWNYSTCPSFPFVLYSYYYQSSKTFLTGSEPVVAGIEYYAASMRHSGWWYFKVADVSHPKPVATPTPTPAVTPTPVPTPSPTPTPTPGPGSCANPDLGVDVELIPVPRVAPGLCAGVGPIDFSLPLVGGISVPQIRVCFVPIWFGTLDLFGVKVNLDLVFAAAAGAMILRWFWRS
jgi:hypothetical protein